MPKCECKHCLNLSNGKGRVLHRTTVARHLLEEKEAQALEDEYQRLHPEENFYHSEEENLYEENLREEDLFKYLQFLPTYDEKVFSNFKEKEKAWPSHRVKSSIVYDNQYEFYSPCVNCKLTKNEAIKLKQCYAAIFQKNARDIRDIEESYMKYGKL
ncbi:7142_t:CDS:2, partial [Rhizophagus irregularis]